MMKREQMGQLGLTKSGASLVKTGAESFPLCEKYGLVKYYTIATDFVITAPQVEKLLRDIEAKIADLATHLKDQEKIISRLLE